MEQNAFTQVIEHGKQWYIIQRTDEFFYVTRQEAREEIHYDADGLPVKRLKYLDIADTTEQFEEDLTALERTKWMRTGTRGQVRIQASDVPFEQWFDTVILNRDCDVRLSRMPLKKTRPNIIYSNEDSIEPMECTLVFKGIKFTFS